MKTLLVLGTGCTKCNQLAAVAQEAADACGMEYRLEKITDFMRFADFGVMLTPALVVDGEVIVCGKIPSVDELRKRLC